MLKKYINPEDLLRTGRKIHWGATLTTESFADLEDQLREGEHLYAYIEPALDGHKRAPMRPGIKSSSTSTGAAT